MSYSTQISLVVVSPDAVAFNGPADSVSVPAEMGTMQVFPGHVPVLARVFNGAITVFRKNQDPLDIIIDEGIVRITQEEVCVIVNTFLESTDLVMENATPASLKKSPS